MDEGEAPDWNDPEMGKTRKWSHRRRGVGNLTGSGAGWAYTRQRIIGGAEWRDGLAVGEVAFRCEAHKTMPLDAGGWSRRSRQRWGKRTRD